MRPLMESCDYEISIPDLEEFIEITHKSGYKFKYTISGGEPLLWSNLQEGVKLLRESDTCCGMLMFTNALNIDALNNEVADCFNEIRISAYRANSKEVKQLKQQFGDKVRIVPREKFYPIPESPIQGTTPAVCEYDKWWYYNRRIYCCAHGLSLYLDCPYSLSNELTLNYVDGLLEIKERLMNDPLGACGRCAANTHFKQKSTKLTNFSKKERIM